MKPSNGANHRRRVPSVLVLAAAALSSHIVRGDPPASQADAARIERIIRATTQAGAATVRWSDPVVQRFDKPAAEAPKGWSITNCTAAVKNGRLVLTGEGRTFVAMCPVPQAALRAKSLRIDMWLEVTPTRKDPAQTRAGLILCDGLTAQNVVADVGFGDMVLYEFAHGSEGKLQQFIMRGRDRVIRDRAMAWDKLVHVSLCADRSNLHGQRDGAPPVVWQDCGPPLKFSEQLCVGLRGTCEEIRLAQWSVRTPIVTVAAALRDAVARAAGFAGSGDMDRFLAERVLPMLSDRSYATREQAHEWLRQMRPLADGVLQKAMAGSPDGELAQRIGEMLEAPVPTRGLVACDLSESPADTAKPPSSQAEK